MEGRAGLLTPNREENSSVRAVSDICSLEMKQDEMRPGDDISQVKISEARRSAIRRSGEQEVRKVGGQKIRRSENRRSENQEARRSGDGR